VPLGSDSNRRSAPWTGSSAATVDGMVLAGHWRHEVAAHQVAGAGVKLAKALVIQLGGAHPRIQAMGPQRFALIDVADASADTLLQQQLPQGRCLQLAGAAEDLLEVERVDQDIWSQVRHWLSGIANQLHDGRGEADRDDVIETQHRGGAALRLAPALAHLVEVPGTGHAHVRMKGEPSIELHHEVFAVRFDRLDPPAFQSPDRVRTGIIDHLAADAAPQGGGRSPDRVAFRQAPAAAPARGRPPSAWCRIRLRAATRPVVSP